MRDLWRLLGYLKPYVGRMTLAAVLLAMSGALMAAVVSTVKPLVNQVLLPGVFSGPVTAERAPEVGGGRWRVSRGGAVSTPSFRCRC
jgi:hypothetical protein